MSALGMEPIASGRAITGRGGIGVEWQGARLAASADSLRLTARILGEIVLSPNEVVAVKVERKFIGCLIRIEVADPAKVIALRTYRNADRVLESLRYSGFVARAVDEFGPGTCVECGAVLSESSDKCAACGWSFNGSGD